MIELHITMIGKSFSPKDKFRIIGYATERFNDITCAKKWIKKNYGKHKQSPIYCDTKEGKTEKVGVVIGFTNADYSHAPVEHWIQQDWVEFRECKTITLR